MTTQCANLERFADGELKPVEANAFRSHLLTCAKCQVGLGEVLRLGMLAFRLSKCMPRPHHPVAYVATNERQPHRAIYGIGETRQEALADARGRRPDLENRFRVLRATARLVKSVKETDGMLSAACWRVFEDSHGDFADLATRKGTRLSS